MKRQALSLTTNLGAGFGALTAMTRPQSGRESKLLFKPLQTKAAGDQRQ